MAMVLMEGFRVIPDGSGHTTLFSASSGTTTWERAASRTGWALQHRNSVSTDSSTTSAIMKITPDTTFTGADVSIGFAVLHPPGGGSSNLTMELIPNPGPATGLGVRMKTNSPIVFTTADSSMSAQEIIDASPITPGWHWWCATARMNQTTGGWFRVYRDGQLVARIEGDTYGLSANRGLFSHLQLTIPAINTLSGAVVSDIIIKDDSTVIPESRVDVLLPRSTVQAGWTPTSGLNHECIDDEPSVNTADYVSTSTVGATDLYRFDPLPHNPQTIYAVQFQARASKSDTGARSMAPVLNGLEGVAKDPGPALSIPQLALVNPATGSAWTKTEVDNVQAGVRLIS